MFFIVPFDKVKNILLEMIIYQILVVDWLDTS